MIEIKWQSSTATCINKILPRLPIDVSNSGPIFTVCQNEVELSKNLSVLFQGNTDTLTFFWEQVSGPQTTIQNPDNLDAGINIEGQTVADRVFKLTVNKGRSNEFSILVEVLARLLSRASYSLVTSSTYNNKSYGNVNFIFIITFDYDTLAFQNIGCSPDFYEFAIQIDNRERIYEIFLQELQQFDNVNREWIVISSVSDPPDFYYVPINQNLIYRIRTVWKITEGSPLREQISDNIRLNPLFMPPMDNIRPVFSDPDENISTSISGSDNFGNFGITRITSGRITTTSPHATHTITGAETFFNSVLVRFISVRLSVDEGLNITTSIAGASTFNNINVTRIFGSNITT